MLLRRHLHCTFFVLASVPIAASAASYSWISLCCDEDLLRFVVFELFSTSCNPSQTHFVYCNSVSSSATEKNSQIAEYMSAVCCRHDRSTKAQSQQGMYRVQQQKFIDCRLYYLSVICIITAMRGFEIVWLKSFMLCISNLIQSWTSLPKK